MLNYWRNYFRFHNNGRYILLIVLVFLIVQIISFDKGKKSDALRNILPKKVRNVYFAQTIISIIFAFIAFLLPFFGISFVLLRINSFGEWHAGIFERGQIRLLGDFLVGQIQGLLLFILFSILILQLPFSIVFKVKDELFS